MRPSSAFVVDERLDVRGLLDLRAAIKAARVHGEDLGTLHDTHGIHRGEHLELPTNVSVWDRVVVEIKADVGSLGGAHHDTLFTGEGLGWQPEQARLFFLEAGTYAAIAILRTRALGCLARAPAERVRVQIGEINEASSREEALAYKADRAFHPTFFRLARRPRGAVASGTRRTVPTASDGSGSHHPHTRERRCANYRTDTLVERH